MEKVFLFLKETILIIQRLIGLFNLDVIQRFY